MKPDRETTFRGICGCDGYFDEGCPACTPAPAPKPATRHDDVAHALRLAALAGMNPAERFHAGEGQTGPGHIAEAARTIAAFLDAMNGKGRQAGFNLARSVEEAANGAR